MAPADDISDGDAPYEWLTDALVAVRLVPLGQSTGLHVRAALEPVVLRVAASARVATLDDLGGCSFRSDLVAMRNETHYTGRFGS